MFVLKIDALTSGTKRLNNAGYKSKANRFIHIENPKASYACNTLMHIGEYRIIKARGSFAGLAK